ncbi:MAG TPA: DUF998 domain-containing protein [Rhodanobacter sp.]|nr:DUF998 domain-containing protein [Rhodanobacter sp.]
MKSLLIKQAIVIPLAAMLVPILLAFFLPGYSSISQHISEVELLDNPIATIQRIAVIVTSVSIVLFGVGVFRVSSGRMGFTAVIAVIAGLSFASNAAFIMGSPLHGLYGLGGFSMVLVPAFFAAEIQQLVGSRRIRQLSLLVTTILMAYLWLMLAGFDPAHFRGLTQRLITVVYYGWFSLVCYWLSYRATGVSVRRVTSFHETAAAG